MINILYLAHGDERYLRQCKYSILTLMEYTPDWDIENRLLLITDSPAYFEDIPVEVIYWSREKIQEIISKTGLIHRLKIEALRHILENYKGHSILLDSDIVFFKDPLQKFRMLEEGKFLMYEQEETLQKPKSILGKKFKKFFKKHPKISLPSGEFSAHEDALLCNCSVVGIPESQASLISRVQELTDYIYPKLSKHIAEQVSFSLVLGQNGEILFCKDILFHWFGHGKNMNRYLIDLFKRMRNMNTEEMIQTIASEKDRAVNMPPNPPKRRWYHIFRKK